MAIYQNILLAVDLEDSTARELLIQHAYDIVQKNQARLSIIYTIEPLNFNVSASAEPIALETDEELIKQAAMDLDRLTEKYHFNQIQKIIKIGYPKEAIIEYAKQLAVDLIIVGNHGKHGLALMLLGSTSNAILHHANCDVLVVKLPHY